MRRSLSLVGALIVFVCTEAGGATASGGARVWAGAGCGGCHTLAAAGASGQGGPNLDQLRPSAAAVAAQVSSGGGGMPSFGATLSAAQIDAVAAYVSSVAGRSTSSPPTSAVPRALAASAVRRLQEELRRLGFFHGPVTGFYGPLTTAAVRRFQAAAGLRSDGIWGPASRRALARRLGGPSNSTAPPTTAGALPAPAAWVQRLQVDLGRLGFFQGPDTGIYGPLTTAAVERFQRAAGIAVDGRWGPTSQRALVDRLGSAH